ncbi:Ap3d1 protein [Coprinopsis cinerea AmutBmut pab1-1]|nr:Ap3d1 protein [Coprinopsis cinerea AmutBmut pab1-1]
MWERTLQDLIRGLRANKKDEARFIAKAVEEIRQEIKSEDMELKAGAVLKLTYLDMLGYDMSWASFHVVEVMSSPKAHLKSVGYLGAVQSFNEDTDVLMLTTNLLKKDLSSNPTDVAITLNGFSHIVTPDLARDLAPEIIAMLTHSRPHIRKRAIIAVYKLMVKYPEVTPQARPRLEERLEDTDPSVVAACVNVLCELARQNPQDYLSLAPQLFHLLTTSSNNWMLIKIVKLFGSLCPHEPRLVKKLLNPITELITTTPAISLLYECVHTCIIGGMLQGSNGASLAKTCVAKLAAFIEDTDQNLKYIALLAMTKIVPSHPHLVGEYRDTILASVSDQDISIRMRALDLVTAMVDQSNLQSIVQQLLTHLVPNTELPSAVRSLQESAEASAPRSSTAAPLTPAYRLTLAERILEMCSASMYENVTNFEWYVSVMVDLVHVSNVKIGAQIRDQLVDIACRVRGVRPYAVKVLYTLLADDALLQNAHDERSCSEALWAAAWICGEYCSELLEPQKLIPYLLQPEVSNLTPDIVAVYIQATVKVFGTWAAELGEQWDDDRLPELQEIVQAIKSRMEELVSNSNVEVQERASNALELFTFISADLKSWKPQTQAGPSTVEGFNADAPAFPKSLYLIQPLISVHELNPVAETAQSCVPVPEGLDLDEWFVAPPPEPVMEERPMGEKKKRAKKGKEKQDSGKKSDKKKKKGKEVDINSGDILTPVYDENETPEDIEERERRKAERLAQLRDDPYYILDDKPKIAAHDVDSIPVVRLDDVPSLNTRSADERLVSLRVSSHSSGSQSFVIDRNGEMPKGATSSRPSQTPPQKPGTPQTTSGTNSPYPAVLSSFPQYDVPDSDIRTATPEPIKVVRAKKGAGKKKRTKT